MVLIHWLFVNFTTIILYKHHHLLFLNKIFKKFYNLLLVKVTSNYLLQTICVGWSHIQHCLSLKHYKLYELITQVRRYKWWSVLCEEVSLSTKHRMFTQHNLHHILPRDPSTNHHQYNRSTNDLVHSQPTITDLLPNCDISYNYWWLRTAFQTISARPVHWWVNMA